MSDVEEIQLEDNDEEREQLEAWKREPLPASGDTLFKPSTNSDRVVLSELLGRESPYVDGYLMAADIIAEKWRSSPKELLGVEVLPDEHWLVYPAYFLYRHHLELRLKALLRQAIDDGEVSPDHERLLTCSHDVAELWNALLLWVKTLLHPKFGENTDSFTTLMQEIRRFDKQADAGRYAEIKVSTAAGKQLVPSFEGVEPLDLDNIYTVMHQMFTYLQWISDAIRQQDEREAIISAAMDSNAV